MFSIFTYHLLAMMEIIQYMLIGGFSVYSAIQLTSMLGAFALVDETETECDCCIRAPTLIAIYHLFHRSSGLKPDGRPRISP